MARSQWNSPVNWVSVSSFQMGHVMYELSEMENSIQKKIVSYQIVYICIENFHNDILDVSVDVINMVFYQSEYAGNF